MTKTKYEKMRNREMRLYGYCRSSAEEIIGIKMKAKARTRKLWHQALKRDMPIRPYGINHIGATVELIKVRKTKRRGKHSRKFVVRTVDVSSGRLELAAEQGGNLTLGRARKEFFGNYGFKEEDVRFLSRTLAAWLCPRVKTQMDSGNSFVPVDILETNNWDEEQARKLWQQDLQVMYQALCLASYTKEGARVFVSLGRLRAQNVRKTGEALFKKYLYAIVSTEDCGNMVDKGTGETAEFEMDLLRPEIDSPPGAGGAGDKKNLNLRKARARIMRPDVVTSADQVKAGDILEFRLVRPKKRKERMQLNWKVVFADDEAKYLMIADSFGIKAGDNLGLNDSAFANGKGEAIHRTCDFKSFAKFLLPRLEAFIKLHSDYIPEAIVAKYPGDSGQAAAVWNRVLLDIYQGIGLYYGNTNGLRLRMEPKADAAKKVVARSLELFKNYFFELYR